jgi:hypothetical protein
MVSDQPRVFGSAAWSLWLGLRRPRRAQVARRTVDRRVDAALFVGSAVFGAGTLASLWHDHGCALNAVNLAAGSLACLALWLRRSWPVAALAVFVAASF